MRCEIASGRISRVGISLLLLVSLAAGCRCEPPGRSGAKDKQLHSSDDSAAGVVEDSEGNLYLVGASGSFRCVVVKCDAQGKVLWHRRLEDKADPKLKSTRCESIVLARGGGVVVAGHTRGKGAEGLVVARFDASGALDWLWRLPLRVGFFTRVLLLARPQHVLVAASTPDEHLFHAISPSGALVWERRFKGLGFSIRAALATGDDGVIAAGRFHPTLSTKGEGLGQEDLAIARFDFKGDGWSRRLLGSAEAEFGAAVITVGDHLITAGHRVSAGEGAARRRQLYLTKSARQGDKVAWERVFHGSRDVRGVDLAPGQDGQLLVIANAVKKPLHARPKAGAQRILDTAFSTLVGQVIVAGADGAIIRTEELDLGASTSLAAITRLNNGTYCVVGKVRPEKQLIRNRIQSHHRMLVLLVDRQGKIVRKQIISSETLKRARAAAPAKPVKKNEAADRRCRQAPACAKRGICAAEGARCVAATKEDCKRSEACKVVGSCMLKQGRCVAGSKGDCEASTGCKEDSICTLRGDACVVDYHSCTKHGWCTVFKIKPPLKGRWIGDMWGSGPEDIFAVGRRTIVHYDGLRWRTQQNHSLSGIFDVVGSGPTDVYAVGSLLTIQRYDGERWHLEHMDKSAGVRGGQLSRVASLGPGKACAYGPGTWCRGKDGTWNTASKSEEPAPQEKSLPARQSGELGKICKRGEIKKAGAIWLMECPNRKVYAASGNKVTELGRIPGWQNVYQGSFTAFARAIDAIHLFTGDGTLLFHDGKRWHEQETGAPQYKGAKDFWSDGTWLYTSLKSRILRRAL